MTSRSVEQRSRRWLRRCTTALTVTTAGAVLVLGAPVTSTSPRPPGVSAAQDGLALASADPHRWPGHPGRRLVRAGEVLRMARRHGTLYVGERIRIPVVVAVARTAHTHRSPTKHATKHTARHSKPAKAQHHRPARVTHPWKLADVSQAKVRRVVVSIARARGVDPHLALAVAWQESGWQQRRISSAGAIGVMQVLPGTSRWMAERLGRPLNPYGLYDNVTAGVALIKVLRSQARPKVAVASYFQGLGSVQDRGMYTSTKAYVKNVVYLRTRVERGWNPV